MKKYIEIVNEYYQRFELRRNWASYTNNIINIDEGESNPYSILSNFVF